MFDKNEELINVIDPESLLENTQVQELNGLITTVVSAPYSKELEEAFYVGSRDVDDNNIFWLYKVDKRTKENSVLTLYGTYSLFDELKAYGLIRDKRPTNATAMVGASAVLEGSRWQVGNITSTHTGTANWYYVSRLEAFWEYLENWNVEFKPRMTFSKGKITGRYIDIVDKLSDDYGKWYEYGDKLMQVTAEQSSDSLYTAFIGRGKGEEVGDGYGRRLGFEKVVWKTNDGKPVEKPLGQDYVEIPYATALYGYSDGKPRTTVVTFEDTEDATLLLEQTYEYALDECRPKLQMKASVLEDGLSELGEICTIIREDIGIRYKTRVFKLTRDFLNKSQRTVEFGDEIVQSTAKRNNNIGKVIKKQEQQTINWLESLQLQLQDTYFNEDGYNYELKADNEYELPGGFYSFNAPIDQNPTKLIYMGAGTMAIANSKKPDGSWNFRTWGTGDGFTADLINASTLSAITTNTGSLNVTDWLTMATENKGILGEYDFGDKYGEAYNYRWFTGDYRLSHRHLIFSANAYDVTSSNTKGGFKYYTESFYGPDYVKLRQMNYAKDYLHNRIDINADRLTMSTDYTTSNIVLASDGSGFFSSDVQINGDLRLTTDKALKVYNILPPDAADNVYINEARPELGAMRFGKDGSSINDGRIISSHDIYKRTYSSASNVIVNDTGVIGRSVSARKYKLNIKTNDLLGTALKTLEIKPSIWFDKGEVESISDSLTNETIEELDANFKLQRHYGFVADEFHEKGATEVVIYDSNGEVEGLAYDRLSMYHHELIKDLYKKVEVLEKQ